MMAPNAMTSHLSENTEAVWSFCSRRCIRGLSLLGSVHTNLFRLGLFVSLVLGAACSSDSPASPSPGAHKVVVLGDSLGVAPSGSESFPAVLQPRVVAKVPGSTLTNASFPGNTTQDGLSRFDSSVSAGTTILVLELGANDGLEGIPVGTIEQNLSTMIDRAKSRGISVLLCGMETLPTYGVDYSTAYHDIFPRLAAKYGIPLVPFLLQGVALNPQYTQSDLVHPNAAGARIIADTVWTYLEPMLSSSVAADEFMRSRGERILLADARRSHPLP
jgi:acyl-CoA thioesterase I